MRLARHSALLAALLAPLAAGCGGTTSAPTPKMSDDKMKDDKMKGDGMMKDDKMKGDGMMKDKGMTPPTK